MCGDGANDCGALRTAHVGISLSEAESSVASAFTAKMNNISCVPIVVREGRTALVTSLGLFKFMVLYCAIEFITTFILYTINDNITDIEYVYIDLFLVLHFAFLFGRNTTYMGPLAAVAPITKIMSLVPVMSIVLQIVLAFVIQLISFWIVHMYPWFRPFQYTNDDQDSLIGYENYAVWTASIFQYIALAAAFSQGAPYRTSIFSNRLFLLSLSFMTVLSIYLTLQPAVWIAQLFGLQMPPTLVFPIVVLCLAAIHLMLSIFIEKYLLQAIKDASRKLFPKNYAKSKYKYLVVNESLEQENSWPPIDINSPKINKSFALVDTTKYIEKSIIEKSDSVTTRL